jgi:hypothetical protein
METECLPVTVLAVWVMQAANNGTDGSAEHSRVLARPAELQTGAARHVPPLEGSGVRQLQAAAGPQLPLLQVTEPTNSGLAAGAGGMPDDDSDGEIRTALLQAVR